MKHGHDQRTAYSGSWQHPCEEIEALQQELDAARGALTRARRWMAKHDDFCPLDEEGDAIVLAGTAPQPTKETT
jgi:hypothetical protein